MKKFLAITGILFATVVSFDLSTVQTSANETKFVRSVDAIPGRYIVVLNQAAYPESNFAARVESASYELAGEYRGNIDKTYDAAVFGFSTEMSEKDAYELSRDPRVKYVEEDSIATATAVQNNVTWGLDRIDQRSYPLNNSYQYTSDGTGVNAYVIDSGIRTSHQDFGGRATRAADFTADGQNGNDCFGHGTHVAGTIGSSTYGVAKNVRLHALKVLTCDGTGSVSGILSAVNWITANRVLPAVANISITLSGPSNSLDTAINNSMAAGVTYSIAAGNFGMDACAYSPARIPNVLTVGSAVTDGAGNDFRMGYSNFGTCVDVFAPGNGIISTSNADDVSSRNMNGTSMAAPHVAGVAALYLQDHPTASPATVSQLIKDGATTGTVINITGTNSPNKMLHSWIGGATAPALPASLTIVKQVTNAQGGTASSTTFGYNATNLGTSTFALVDNDAPPFDRYVNPNLTNVEGGGDIVITEASMSGWNLNSIQCVETAGTGMTNLQNSVVDVASRKATIRVEQGEQVVCTFNSQELAPTAATATVSGRVVDNRGRGLKGISMVIVNQATGQTVAASTNSFGYYSLPGLRADALHVLMANSKRFVFEPDSRSVFVNGDLTTSDFFATSR